MIRLLVTSGGRDFWGSFKKNRGALFSLYLLCSLVLLAVFASWIAPYSPDLVHEGFYRVPPVWHDGGSWRFILGTDDLGRDLLSRLIHGTQVSMSVGLAVTLISIGFGTLIGLVAGYFGGVIDSMIMRGVDMLMSLPSMLLAIVVVAVMGPSLENAVIAVSIVALPGIVRIVRASTLAEKSKSYVDASTSFGASHLRLAVVAILPNCAAPIIVQAALVFSDGILNAAALGFLGLGAQPPTPEWGVMLSDGRNYMGTSSWLVTLPGLCILTVVLSMNLLGDGLRDALDPKLK